MEMMGQPMENPINLRFYWHIILERRWLVITTFISVFILSLVYLFRATPIYKASAQIEIGRDNMSVLKIEGLSLETREQDYLQTQYKKLMSRTLIESVASDLHLEKNERYGKARDIAKALAKNIQIVPIRLSRLVNIEAEDPDPRLAALIANRLATNFIQFNLDEKRASITNIADVLREEVGKKGAELEAAEAKVNQYREEKNILSFEDSANIVLQTVKQAQADFSAAQLREAEAKGTVEKIEKLLKDGAKLETIPQVSENLSVQAMIKDLGVAKAEFAELQKKYLSAHPKYQQKAEKIQELENRIRIQCLDILGSLRNAASIAESTLRNKRVLLDEAIKSQKELQSASSQYMVLKRKADQLDALYKSILASMQERELTGRNTINNIHMVDDAVVPFQPAKPRKALTLFLGVFGGLAVAIGLAFFVNYLDDSVKTQEDVESYLRLPFLGYVPNIKTNSVEQRDLQAHSQPQSSAAEAFRTIRATIALTPKSETMRVLALTSTIPSEGKSLLASNLSIVMAQTGQKTLLIDADLRRPSIHKAFLLHSPQGLSSYLSGETDNIDKLVHHTDVPNLDVVCCGALPSTPAELIGSTRMRELLQSLRSRYDRILLDCPPVSAVSDPLIIAAMADGVVYVNKFNKIRREHARKAIARIQNAGIHILGLVLNDIDFEGRDSYYYSYYYYQNRYYMSHYSKENEGRKSDRKEPAPTRNGS